MKENTVEIKVELVGYEELLEKLNNIKKLLQEIENIEISFEKDKATIKEDGTKNDQTSSGFILTTDGGLKATNGSIDGWSKKETNHTLEDLKQNLINDLYESSYHNQTDIELLKVILENKKY